MNKNSIQLIFALSAPILSLVFLASVKAFLLSQGSELIFDVAGRDPRDLLRGHYVQFEVLYGFPVTCPDNESIRNVYLCLDQKTLSENAPDSCNKYIAGVCSRGLFSAGIERYYVGEHTVQEVEQEIRDKRAQIEISLLSNGHAQIRNLLINGKPWKK